MYNNSNNFVVRQVNKYKLLCPKSTIADNYKYYVVNIELHRQIGVRTKILCTS